MATLKSLPTIKAQLSNNNLSSDNTPTGTNHSTPRTKNVNIQSLSSKSPPFPKPKQKQAQTNTTTSQPSIAEIERVIGAGVFRDRDTERESESEKTLFDKLLTNSFGNEEGSVEKQLREAGEWIIDKTETTSQSNGKKIRLFVFQWILPIWIVSMMLALGIIKLPFSTTLLDDLLL